MNGKGVFNMAFKEGYRWPWREGEFEGYGYYGPYGYPKGYFGYPLTRYWYDQKEGRYFFEFEMPGVDKKDISLDFWGENFCFQAKKDDAEYSGCYMFPHFVEPDKAKAHYENGVLRVFAPLKDWEKRTHVEVQ